MNIIDNLYEVIVKRKKAKAEDSYTAHLLKLGPDVIARKVGEESIEVVIAALSGKKSQLVSESADLLYHLSVLWAAKGIKPADVAAMLQSREGQSGHAEKAARKKPAAKKAPARKKATTAKSKTTKAKPKTKKKPAKKVNKKV